MEIYFLNIKGYSSGSPKNKKTMDMLLKILKNVVLKILKNNSNIVLLIRTVLVVVFNYKFIFAIRPLIGPQKSLSKRAFGNVPETDLLSRYFTTETGCTIITYILISSSVKMPQTRISATLTLTWFTMLDTDGRLWLRNYNMFSRVISIKKKLLHRVQENAITGLK